MVDLAPHAAAQVQAPAVPSARRYYVLAILTLVYALNFLDRTIFNVLIEPIKKEFVLSDTTMGLLAGFGFVLFYSLLGIPIARLADRLSRRNIVAIAFAFWSAMTFLCGMAQSVTTLALARIGVGIGYSLLSTAVTTSLGALAVRLGGTVHPGRHQARGLVPTFRSPRSIAATPFRGLWKVMGTSKSIIPVPLSI
jgi:MFS family permease